MKERDRYVDRREGKGGKNLKCKRRGSGRFKRE